MKQSVVRYLLNDDDIACKVYMYMVYTHELAYSSEFHSIITSWNQLDLEALCSMLPASLLSRVSEQCFLCAFRCSWLLDCKSHIWF